MNINNDFPIDKYMWHIELPLKTQILRKLPSAIGRGQNAAIFYRRIHFIDFVSKSQQKYVI